MRCDESDLCAGLCETRDHCAGFVDGDAAGDADEDSRAFFVVPLRAKDRGEFLRVEPVLWIFLIRVEIRLEIWVAVTLGHTVMFSKRGLEECFGGGRSIGGGCFLVLDILECDLVLHDLFDDEFEVGPSIASDERACPVEELLESSLDQGTEFELAANLLNDFFTFQRFDHLLSFGVP